MPVLYMDITKPTSSSARYVSQIAAVQADDNMDWPGILRGEALRATGTAPSYQGLGHYLYGQVDQKEIEFLHQQKAFLDIPPLMLSPYRGEFVVSHNGEILDHDRDLVTLTRRFFSQHGDIPVYIAAALSDDTVEHFDTPFYE